MQEWFNAGKKITGEDLDFVKALNTEDIHDYKIREMKALELEVDIWQDHPTKVLIQATKQLMLRDHIFRMFRTMQYE